MPAERATRERRNIGPLPVRALMGGDTLLDTVQFFQRLVGIQTGSVKQMIPTGKIHCPRASRIIGDVSLIQMSCLKHFDALELILSVTV